MEVTIGRNFQLRQYEQHHYTVKVSDSDIPNQVLEQYPNMTLAQKLWWLRNEATRQLVAEIYVYGKSPDPEDSKAMNERRKDIEKRLALGAPAEK